MRLFKKKYYCIKQHDITDCAAACLATISKQYGLKMPISKIREIAGTDKKGTNVYGLVKVIRDRIKLCVVVHKIKKGELTMEYSKRYNLNTTQHNTTQHNINWVM